MGAGAAGGEQAGDGDLGGARVVARGRDVVLDEVTGTYQCSQDEFGKLNLGVLYAF